jgi:hypothetical protein
MEDRERVSLIEEHFRMRSIQGDLIEIRGLHDKSTGIKGAAAGLFSDPRKAARVAIQMTNAGLQTFSTINPVSPASHYARNQRINHGSWRVPFTAANHDIARRRCYFFDLDPARPGFEDQCSTMQEKAAAWEQAQGLKLYLASLEWPDPIVIDSGNGYHLIYCAGGVPVDREATQDLKSALRFLKGKFPYLDPGVYNPGRVARVPHTVNRKGGATEERPHRRAKVLHTPDTFVPVAQQKVQSLAMEGQPTTDDGHKMAKPVRSVDSELLIDEQGVEELIAEFPDQLDLAGTSYEGEVTYFALAECPFKGGQHTGQNVGHGKSAITLRPDSIGFHCFSSDCAGYAFVDLLKFLKQETGRWPTTPIWPEDDPEELESRWGCAIEDLSLVPTKPDTSHYDEERTKREFSFHARLEDKRISEQQTPDELRSFRERMNTIWKAVDYDAMLDWLETVPGAYCGEPA